MRNPVISSEISPKSDGVPTPDFLPHPQVSAECRYHDFRRENGPKHLKKRYHNNFSAVDIYRIIVVKGFHKHQIAK